MNNKVTIIVPIYNVEEYLAKCVNSLVNQTYKNIEILLVNDGSPDNSGSMCDEFAKTDSRIKVVHKENGGYGSVLEYSINNIDSEYFIICDPDDWLELDAIEKLMKTREEYNADLVVARKKLVYLDNSFGSDIEYFKHLKENYVYNTFEDFLYISCTPHAKLYKTELCKNISFPKKINNTDYLLYHVYLTRIKSAVYINEELANYFINRPGNSFNEDIKLTEKSLKSNSIVTQETLAQLNETSSLYPQSNMTMFIRACRYLALMKKNNMYNEEYDKILNDVIDKTQKYKRYLKKNISLVSDSKTRNFIKYLLYTKCFSSKFRKLAITLLSKIVKE